MPFNFRIKYLPPFIGFFLLFSQISCTSENETDNLYSNQNVDKICVNIASQFLYDINLSSRSDGDSNNSQSDSSVPGLYDEGIKDPALLIPYSLQFDENTVIQVAQQTNADREPFRNESAIFDFDYMPGQVEDWDDNDSYNFAGYNQKTPLEWNSISKGGHYNGGFALYSLYFPIDNSLRKRYLEDGTIIYSVMEDQSTLENLKRSDILGAYHSTGFIFERIRFRMFHLMTYVRIRLYVPLYEEEKHTGFREGALLSATLNNVTPDFAIEWSAVRTPDDQGPKVSPLSGEGEIQMYLHPLEEGMTNHPITEINYKDYLKDGYFDQGITGDKDKVRVYDFSVIIPEQKGIKGEDGKESNFTSTKFLNFKFHTNSGAETTYYFQENLSVSKTESQLNMVQGTFQYLELYVPRVGNQLIPLGAYVNSWSNKGGNMLLNEQKDN